MNNAATATLAALLSAAALAQPPENLDRPGNADAVQQRMQQMHEQMERIRNEEDPAERHRLMREHMVSMHEGMMAMQETMQRQAEGRQGQQQCPQDDTECRMEQLQMQQQMMGQRMGMMQMMMEQMVQHMRLRHDMMTRARSGDEPKSEEHEEHHPDQ